MNARTAVVGLFSFVLGAALFAASESRIISTAAPTPVSTDKPRVADRQAIKAHIDKIFEAYIQSDCGTIRKTHAQDWIGFTSFAKSIVRGIDGYMHNSAPNCNEKASRPFGISGYSISEIDYAFYDNVALVPYVADVTYGRDSSIKAKLRSLDVYAKSDGEWNQVGSNIGPHPDTIQSQIKQSQELRRLTPEEMANLMNTRESVWRAYFANDRSLLEKLIPKETIAINAGEDAWSDRSAVLSGAAGFARSGAKLIRLEFPKTEVRVYGNVAILYSNYLYEFEVNGKKTTQSGRATEVFVLTNGAYVNSGWHLDAGK